MTFINQIITGAIKTSELDTQLFDEAIDNAVDAWHASEGTIPMHEYLGLSLEEYNQWVQNPRSIDSVVAARRTTIHTSKVTFIRLVVTQNISDDLVVAVPNSIPQAERGEWAKTVALAYTNRTEDPDSFSQEFEEALVRRHGEDSETIQPMAFTEAEHRLKQPANLN